LKQALIGEGTIHEAMKSYAPPGALDEQGRYTEGYWKGYTQEEAGRFIFANPESSFPEHAAGATFSRGGLFFGRVHAPEEIIPQATAQRGPGPIARALDELTAGSGMGGSGSPITINLGGITVQRMDSETDIRALADKLMFVMRGDLENLMRRNIGYRRGGSLGR
jgi:hypothetical protein